MVRRGWARSIFFAALAGAGTTAAQLGLGYGLGIIAWVVPTTGTGASGTVTTSASGTVTTGAWTAGLAWATWIAATSVVVGAIVGDRVGGNVESGRAVRVSWCLTMALVATLGTAVAIPLVAVPASAAQIVDNYAPHLLVGIYAAAGVVLGLVVALVALTSRAVAANVIASACWLWAVAVIAVVDSIAAGRGPEYAQLAVWKYTEAGPMWHSFYIPGALLMLGTALLVGGLSAFPAAGRGDGRFGVAMSGALGPLLVAVAYALAAPAADRAPAEQVSAFHTAPFMIVAGLAGSVLVAAVGGVSTRPRKRRRSRASQPSTATTSMSWSPHSTPTLQRRATAVLYPRTGSETKTYGRGTTSRYGAA